MRGGVWVRVPLMRFSPSNFPRLTFRARKNAQRLAQRLGINQAQNELRWMKEAFGDGSIQSPVSLERMLERRVRGEPLQYILGTQPFGSLELFVSPPTLIPRPETEEWVLWLSEVLRADLLQSEAYRLNALDICTGTGCIPLLLREELASSTNLHALGVDISASAIALATRNANHSVPSARQSPSNGSFEALRLDVFSSDFVSTLRQHPLYPFDVITSNPPYISRTEYVSLSRTVKDYEDPLALLGEAPGAEEADTQGLAFYHRIASLLAAAPDLLRPGGRIVLEIGASQAEAVTAILAAALGPRLEFLVTRKDGAGLDRVVHARVH